MDAVWFYHKGYDEAKQEMILKLQCCQNCKHGGYSHKCPKGMASECVDYSLWEIHSYDCVEMR